MPFTVNKVAGFSKEKGNFPKVIQASKIILFLVQQKHVKGMPRYIKALLKIYSMGSSAYLTDQWH